MTRSLQARVEVTLKPGIRDPQGQAIENAMAGLGFAGFSGVRVGKSITFRVEGPRAEAERKVAEICDRLLANPVIEQFHYHIEEDGIA
jgi:phosphoribosylformylglycinamidine synthase